MRNTLFSVPIESPSGSHKTALLCLVSVACALPCFAKWASTDAPRLSSAPDTEATTNVVFDAGGEDARLFRLSVELSATESNSVDVAFGRDMDGNGALDRHETDVVVGWDSGEWFFRDRRARVEMREARPSGSRKLDWRLSLDENLKATSLSATDTDGIVFSGVVPPTMFDTNWNMIRITVRGLSEPDGAVSCRVSAKGVVVIMR